MTRGSEDIDPIRCRLLGGPHCGAQFLVEELDNLPDEWWVFEEKQGNGIALIARRDGSKGGERYVLSAFEGGPEAFYASVHLQQSVMVRRPQSWRQGETA